MVIMGTHGHGKLGQALIGSVASEVIRKCAVPVMVVRLPENGQPRTALNRQPASGDDNQDDAKRAA
jgi:hypothetical protein